MVTLIEAFRRQNPELSARLMDHEIEGWAEHHAGGLLVLGSWTSDARRYVKAHDTWGPGLPDEPGEIVVHEYDPETAGSGHLHSEVDLEDGIVEQIWTDGSYVWFFTNPEQAFAFFLSRVEG